MSQATHQPQQAKDQRKVGLISLLPISSLVVLSFASFSFRSAQKHSEKPIPTFQSYAYQLKEKLNDSGVQDNASLRFGIECSPEDPLKYLEHFLLTESSERIASEKELIKVVLEFYIRETTKFRVDPTTQLRQSFLKQDSLNDGIMQEYIRPIAYFENLLEVSKNRYPNDPVLYHALAECIQTARELHKKNISEKASMLRSKNINSFSNVDLGTLGYLLSEAEGTNLKVATNIFTTLVKDRYGKSILDGQFNYNTLTAPAYKIQYPHDLNTWVVGYLNTLAEKKALSSQTKEKLLLKNTAKKLGEFLLNAQSNSQ